MSVVDMRLAMKMLEDREQELQRVIVYDKKQDAIVFKHEGGDYEVDLCRIVCQIDLMYWLLHLGQKVWFKKYYAMEFARRVFMLKGWEFTGITR